MNSEYQFTVTADVVVCGAGTAGSIAAIAAAREGKSVALIEQFGIAGGSAPLSLVTPMMHTHIRGNPMNSYLSQEINERLLALGAASGDGSSFDPLMISIVLEDLLLKENVRILYHTLITGVKKEGNAIQGIVVHNKSGKGLITGKVYIDATGDGDVSYLAEADFTAGEEETGKNQPVSLRYMIGGIDIPKFWNFVQRYENRDQPEEVDPDRGISTAMTIPNTGKWPLEPVFLDAVEKGDITREDAIYWQVFSIPGRKDCLAFNCPEFFENTNGTDNGDLTYVQLHGKKAILRQLRFYRKYFEGFDDAYISDISVMVGIRESRRIVADYNLTAEDVVSHRKFEDAIAQSNYPVDIHGRKLRNIEIRQNKEDRRPFYEIPYRCLAVKGIANLLVAGRCIGSDFIAQSSLRIMPTCRAMGEACGIAAAISLDENVGIHELDGARVRSLMKEKGAQFV